jgi:S1-C subfamily serine protease
MWLPCSTALHKPIPGDEAKVALLRKGKEMTLKVQVGKAA